jgi:F420-non-reducing hydrogenase iron-sulfur subunit
MQTSFSNLFSVVSGVSAVSQLKEKHMDYEPKIIGFTCNWCTYAAADLAGVSRMQYPPNIRLVRVMCSGMVHPRLVVEALTLGADGVMVMG